MNHPPIPEMEGYHVEVGRNGDLMYLFIFYDANGSVTLDSREQRQRAFIAARFEVAWRDEAEALTERPIEQIPNRARANAVLEAKMLARQWRAWGKGEWEP